MLFALFVILGISAVAVVWTNGQEAHSRESRPDEQADSTADPTKLPAVDGSVDTPPGGDYLVRSWGVRKCLGATGASDGIVMEASLDSCEAKLATIQLSRDSRSYLLAPRQMSAGGDYGGCLVADGTAVGQRFRDGACHRDNAGEFVFDAPVDAVDVPQVYRVRHVASDFCMTVSGTRVVQRECRDGDPMQEFVLEPAD